jgi:DNA-binding NtrC family response regulator
MSEVELRVPPLAEREGDLYMLVCHFLREFTPVRRVAPGLSPSAWKAVSAYAFAGNVGELARTIAYANAAAGGREIDRLHLPEVVARENKASAS